MCVQMRSGVELWLEHDRLERLQEALQNITSSKFIKLDDQTINSADIVGIFTALTMADYTHRKNGQWKCEKGNWHDRGTKCECMSQKDKQLITRRDEAIRNCGKCRHGFIEVEMPDGRTAVKEHECVINIK